MTLAEEFEKEAHELSERSIGRLDVGCVMKELFELVIKYTKMALENVDSKRES